MSGTSAYNDILTIYGTIPNKKSSPRVPHSPARVLKPCDSLSKVRVKETAGSGGKLTTGNLKKRKKYYAFT